MSLGVSENQRQNRLKTSPISHYQDKRARESMGRHHRTEAMNAVDQFGMDTVGAVSTLVTANQYMQALVLLYSAIDTLAWVSRSAGNVTRADFCRWVDVYMQPQSRLGCTAEDLYGARCSILHSSAAESKLSREGRVNELWYVT